MLSDPAIIARKEEIISEVRILLDAIRGLKKNNDVDPFTDPATLAESVATGIMDAPHLKNNPFARGEIRTRIINGACEVVDENNQKVTESKRLKEFLN